MKNLVPLEGERLWKAKYENLLDRLRELDREIQIDEDGVFVGPEDSKDQ